MKIRLPDKMGQTDSNQKNRKATLPRSIIVPQKDPHRYVRETIDNIFSDRFMAFLALLLVPIITVEFFVTRAGQVYDFLEICDWTIIILFLVEYVSKLYLADDRWAHFKNKWHLLDLIIVAIPFVQFIPFLGLNATGSASLLLRLLRLPRVFAAAGRATSGQERTDLVAEVPEVSTEAVIRRVDETAVSKGMAAETLTWEQLSDELLDRKKEEWIDIFNVSDEGFTRLSQMLRISEPHFKSGIIDEIYPHIDYVSGASFIFLQSGQIMYPEGSRNFLTISKTGFILVCTGTKLISISRHDFDLLNRIQVEDPKKFVKVGESFLVSILFAALDSLLTEYRQLLSEIEIEVIQIGNIPRSKLPPDFLERIYQLTKEVSRLDSNLVHFKDLLGIIITKQIPLQGFGEDAQDAFKLLEDGASYLKEISDGLVDSLKSIIELYINQESFETNRILKILAVITSIAVIPAAVTGLLGMNVLDTPFKIHLWEIAFMIGIAACFSVYSFVKLGWLRS